LKLKVPKGQYNSFGKYSYRSCEDILESAKPVVNGEGCVLTIKDSVRQFGERFYIEAEAALFDVDDCTSVAVTAVAREDETRKGMDASQITGAASSYARKYALSGLFALDDTRDADAADAREQDKPKKNEAGPIMFKCENCGKILEPYINNGKEIGIRRHAESSRAKFGKVLCLDCIARTQGAASENAG
jgi:hypothetical protein